MSHLAHTAMNIDVYKQGFSFKVSKEREFLPSLIGTMLTILIATITLLYFQRRYVTLVERSESNVQDFLLPNALPYGTVFEYNVGQPTPNEDFKFRLIFNLWHTIDLRNPDDKERVGEMKIYMYHHYFNLTTWDWEKVNVETPLKHHTCSVEDINEWPDDIHTYMSEDYYEDYQCLDKNQNVKVWYNSAYDYQTIHVSFTPCKGPGCYEEPYLKERLKTFHYDILWTYQEFAKNKYGSQIVTDRIGYLNSPSFMQQRTYKVVYQKNHITNHEVKIYNPLGEAIEIDFMESTKNALLMPTDSRFDWYFRFDISISSDIVFYEKGDFTALQLLGDTTALFEGLYLIGVFIMFGVLQVKVLRENYIINNVFRAQLRDDQKITRVNNRFHSWLFLFCCQWRPEIRSKFKKRQIALDRVSKELDVVYFIRKQIQMHSLLKAMTTKY